MDLNLGTFLFLFLRISPFILVSFFTLSSIFNSDLRGIVYIFGLLWAIFVNFLVGNNINLSTIDEADKAGICDFVLFGNDGKSPIPVGQTILGFTFFYLFSTLILKDRDYINKNVDYSNIPNVPTLGECLVTPWQMLSADFLKFIPNAISNAHSVAENKPTIFFFTILIFFDIFWNTNLFRWLKQLLELPLNYCYTGKQTALAYIIGIIIGMIWGYVIYSMKSPELQYFPEFKNNEVCKKASATKYKCKVYKNGKLVQ